MGLQLPEIDQLDSSQIAGRAVRDFERKTGATVKLATACDSTDLPLPVKIALYRLIQESLANGFRHGGGSGLSVEVACRGSWLDVTVCDKGTGFDPLKVDGKGHFGLQGMRERVEVLGGSFHVQTAPGQGTAVRAGLPMQLAGFEE
jgi:signal transduction histidine kinase